jgi:hypothetical protein
MKINFAYTVNRDTLVEDVMVPGDGINRPFL